MIFESLYLRNLGVFRGEHTIDLAPMSKSRPVVLIGALNGAGKTTIIESLQLALYGRRSSYGWRGATSYPQYLTELRNRHSRLDEPTVVEILIRLNQTRTLCVRREWSYSKSNPRECVSVFVNGDSNPDLVLSESWDDEVEKLLPARLAELFLFDGEKIERLADPAKSADVLRTAISSLLGLDLIDHLVNDLELLRYRQKQKTMTEAEASRITALDELIDAAEKKQAAIRAEEQTAEAEAAEIKSIQGRLETSLHSSGGERYKQREALAAEHGALLEKRRNLENSLRNLAGGQLPLALVTPLLHKLLVDARRNSGSLTPDAARRVIVTLGSLRDFVGAEKLSVAAKQRLTLRIDKEISAITAGAAGLSGVDWERVSKSVEHLLSEELPKLQEAMQRQVALLGETSDRILEIEEYLRKTPEADQLAELLRQQGANEARLADMANRLAGCRAQRLTCERELSQLSRGRFAALEVVTDSSDAARIADYCSRSISSLSDFRSRLVDMRRATLEGLILDSFKRLVRKEDLIGSVTLNPETMSLMLTAPGGESMTPQQLSAGERQLLAVSTLWALARATGRPIPIVIDTPLGRLDGPHRENIVSCYFPEASDQVILLSTDTEVTHKFSEILDRAITYRYLLHYDATEKSSSFRHGYFESAA
jgi:DNA sulfur modification protein DndD